MAESSKRTGKTPNSPAAKARTSRDGEPAPHRDAPFPPMTYWAKATATVLGVGLLFALAYMARTTLLMVAIAFVVAVGLEPSVRLVQKLKIRRGLAVAVIFIGTLVMLVGFLLIVIPPVVGQLDGIATDLPGFLSKLGSRSDWLGRLITDYDLAAKTQAWVQNLPKTIAGSFDEIAGAAGQIVGGVFNAVTVFILTLYFMLAAPRIVQTIGLLAGGKGRDQALNDALDRIGGYVTGNITTSIIAGITSFIFLEIVGVPYAAALSFWVAVWDLIPTVGATIGAVPAIILASTQSLGLGAGTAAFFIIYQAFEGYALEPRIYSKAVDLSPVAILVALLIGGALLGIVGMLLALPITAAGKVLVQYWYTERFGEIRGPDEPAEAADAETAR